VAGVRDSVVVETKPGRIEAIVLAPGTHGLPQGGDIPTEAAGPLADPASVREQIEASIKAANQRLAVHQRVAGWRLWPDADFPRTHTLKVKRDIVRTWAAVDEPLPVRQGS
jgi:long-chain acyl-CoA synthetase